MDKKLLKMYRSVRMDQDGKFDLLMERIYSGSALEIQSEKKVQYSSFNYN